MTEPTDRPGYSFDPGPPPEASRFLANKGMRPSFSWEDVEPEEHAVAFAVAKAGSMDVLTAIREDVQRALDEGLTFREFQRNLRPRLEALGWWGYGETRDPMTGQVRPARLGTPRRLRTIYRANLRSARAAGQWERIERTKRAMPYLLYQLGPSERHRPHHESKEGLVLPVDDPFWDQWMPPNGWGCKCWVRQLSRREAEERGIDTAPQVKLVEHMNRRTGELREVPQGLDPAWSRNPGKQRRQAMEDLLQEKLVAYDPEAARAAMRDMATSWLADRVIRGQAEARVPVARISEGAAAALGARTRIAVISPETAAKQLANHAELDPSDYRRLASLMEDGRAVLQEGGRHVAFIERTDQLPWLAVVKTAAEGSELFLVSFYRASSSRYVNRLLRRGQLLGD